MGLKLRRRGASDCETLLSVIYSLAQGDGSLCDVDRLRADDARRKLLGLSEVPASQRLSEYLYRFSDSSVNALISVARKVVRKIAPAVMGDEIASKGYAPVFAMGIGKR